MDLSNLGLTLARNEDWACAALRTLRPARVCTRGTPLTGALLAALISYAARVDCSGCSLHAETITEALVALGRGDAGAKAAFPLVELVAANNPLFFCSSSLREVGVDSGRWKEFVCLLLSHSPSLASIDLTNTATNAATATMLAEGLACALERRNVDFPLPDVVVVVEGLASLMQQQQQQHYLGEFRRRVEPLTTLLKIDGPAPALAALLASCYD